MRIAHERLPGVVLFEIQVGILVGDGVRGRSVRGKKAKIVERSEKIARELVPNGAENNGIGAGVIEEAFSHALRGAVESLGNEVEARADMVRYEHTLGFGEIAAI